MTFKQNGADREPPGWMGGFLIADWQLPIADCLTTRE